VQESAGGTKDLPRLGGHRRQPEFVVAVWIIGCDRYGTAPPCVVVSLTLGRGPGCGERGDWPDSGQRLIRKRTFVVSRRKAPPGRSRQPGRVRQSTTFRVVDTCSNLRITEGECLHTPSRLKTFAEGGLHGDLKRAAHHWYFSGSDRCEYLPFRRDTLQRLHTAVVKVKIRALY
jgi:hypothetical protein